MIDHYCFGMVEGDAFLIFDQLFSAPIEAVKTLQKMQEDGKVWNEVQGLLTWGLKIYLTLLDFYQQGIADTKQIIAATKLHPFVVSKNMKQLPLLVENKEQIISFFQHVIDLEYAIKS